MKFILQNVDIIMINEKTGGNTTNRRHFKFEKKVIFNTI